jgi:squalene cyclase
MHANPGWSSAMKIDPLPALSSASNPALLYFVKRDLLGQLGEVSRTLWDLPEPARLLKKQAADGSWHYPGRTSDAEFGSNHDLLETFRNLRLLVELYACDRRHPAVEKAAEYVFSCQTPEGDIRGILANQYMPYYMGALLYLLIRAGFADDFRLLQGLDWLLSMRQNDGAWMIPLQKYGIKGYYQYARQAPLQPDRALPSNHLATGMVLRAFSIHPRYMPMPAIQKAAQWLKGRMFTRDSCNDHQADTYWTRFQFPFWWTDLLSTLTVLQHLGFQANDPDIASGLQWFLQHQNDDGCWHATYEKKADADLWVTLAICRLFRNYNLYNLKYTKS